MKSEQELCRLCRFLPVSCGNSCNNLGARLHSAASSNDDPPRQSLKSQASPRKSSTVRSFLIFAIALLLGGGIGYSIAISRVAITDATASKSATEKMQSQINRLQTDQVLYQQDFEIMADRLEATSQIINRMARRCTAATLLMTLSEECQLKPTERFQIQDLRVDIWCC